MSGQNQEPTFSFYYGQTAWLFLLADKYVLCSLPLFPEILPIASCESDD
jgi:hypothetical protein